MGLIHRLSRLLDLSSPKMRLRRAAQFRARRQRLLEPLEERRVMAVLINEFVLNHVGTDTHEYIEIIAEPNTDLSHLTLIQIEGDGGGAGLIDTVQPLGVTDANGIYRTPFSADRFENGSVTLHVVAGFTGSVGLDLDTNNDGVRDVDAWSLPGVDSVAINDGGIGDRTYSAVVFFPGFGGNAFAPGGASRIPGIPDTNSTNDWLLNDFDGAGLPGFTGTLTPPEVPNTPGQPNQVITPTEIKFDPTAFIASEGNGGGFVETTVVTVRRTGDVSGSASVQVEVHPGISTPVTATGGTSPVAGVDYDSSVFPITVSFAPGQDAAQVPIRLHADSELEPTETLDLRLVPGSATGIAPISSQDTAVLNILNDDAAITPIYAIQGSGDASPLVNQSVTTVGVVVADFQGPSGQNGFYIQDESGDGVTLTSDGIFVFVPAANPLSSVNVSVGDRVRISGQVREFNTLTELDFVSEITVLASGVSIAATPVAFPEAVNGDLERYEGMLISIPHAMTVQQNFFQGRFGQVTLASGGRLFTPTNEFDAGSPQAIALADENARRLLVLDDGSNAQNPNPIPYIGEDNTLRAGDSVSGLEGVIDFGPINSNTSIRDYRLHPTAPPIFARLNERTDEPTLRTGNLKVSSFNVLNYFTTFGSRGASNAAEFERQSDKIVSAILAIGADVLGLIELENNGPVAIGELVNRLNAEAGAGTYAYIDTGVIGGDEIAVGHIYKTAAVAPFGSAFVDLDPVHHRPPVAQTFRLLSTGEKLTVVVNHFKSKSAPLAGEAVDPRDLDQGDGQGFYNYTRTQQAVRLAAFLEEVKTASGDPDVLIVGDLNAYAKEDPIQVLEAAGYVNQVERFDPAAYSFVFDGQSGSLDYALASSSLAASVLDVEAWHINADEPSVIDYQLEFKPQDLYEPHAYRSSDHDPVVVSLVIPSSFEIPRTADNVRFATFNASLNRNVAGQLLNDLSHPNDPADAQQALRVQQAQNVAEVIQRVRPDVVLINEFDFDPAAAELFRDNFLEVSQHDAAPIEYPYLYIAPSNTGIASGFDLDNSGAIGGPNDAFGFGFFPGQFGMLLLSQYPIVEEGVRTFQEFLWKDMPGALLPDDPSAPAPADWYSAEELNVFRLSSKSHWDVPIEVAGQVIHVLASHPTPPVFDGPEDRNGTRNHDEIRLWADYVTPGAGDYIYDDNGVVGGIAPGARFVILGDQNSDPLDGDSIPGAIQQLLENPRINTSLTPHSEGGPDAAARQGGANNTHLSDPRFDTADFADTAPGNLRADYVLPSRHLGITDAQVFWPTDEDPLFYLVGDFDPAIPGGFPTSDHRLVWLDVTPQAFAGQDGETLTIGGTSGDDVILVERGRGNEIVVSVNGDEAGRFDRRSVELIVAEGLSGNDAIVVSPLLRTDAILRGGQGNDVVYGGSGNNMLLGGDGLDLLLGGLGRDVLIGGRGQDLLVGGLGDDLLIGGETAHDDNDAALLAILARWSGPGSYQSRVNALRTGNGAPPLNASTVHDDEEADILLGLLGRDYFFDGLGDLLDDSSQEFVD